MLSQRLLQVERRFTNRSDEDPLLRSSLKAPEKDCQIQHEPTRSRDLSPGTGNPLRALAHDGRTYDMIPHGVHVSQSLDMP